MYSASILNQSFIAFFLFPETSTSAIMYALYSRITYQSENVSIKVENDNAQTKDDGLEA